MKTLTEIAIEKSRAGVYKDNPENRRLHRVGQRYGSSGKNEAPEDKELRIKVNPELKVGGTLLDHWSEEDFDTVKNNGHISFWDGGSIVNSIERRNNKWVSKTSSGEKEISSREVYSLLKKHYDNEKKNEQEGKKLSFSLKFNPKPKPKSETPAPTTGSQRKMDIERVNKMSDDELARVALGYDADKYAEVDAAYEKAKAAFKEKWGDLQGMVDRISSMKDVEELLEDSKALGEKLKAVYNSSPYTSETIQALRKRVINQLKKGSSIDNVEVKNFAVEHQRSYWKDKDFTAREGEFLAAALQKDAASRPAAGDMGDLYNTESTLEKHFHKKLNAKEFNKLVKIVADHQGRQPRQQRGESTIGGYKDFERVMSNLDTEDGQPKGEKKGATDDSPKSGKAEETFTRVNIPDIPNSGKVNLKKYLSAKRKAAVDEAWSKAGDNLSPERLKQVYDGLVSAFNENFDSTPKAKRAENLYTILKVKNAIEKK